jgi:hypothetical protein
MWVSIVGSILHHEELGFFWCRDCNISLLFNGIISHLSLHGLTNGKTLLAELGIDMDLGKHNDSQVYQRLVHWYKNGSIIEHVPVELGYHACPFDHPDGLVYCLKNEQNMKRHIRSDHNGTLF